MEKRIPAYSLALQREMALVAGSLPDRLPVHTVFFGGGTPSLMPIDALSAILKTARDRFDFLPDYEMTLEANPGTLAPGYLEGLRKLGFNRLSFGMQSADPQELKLLTRLHDFYEVIESVRAARAAGFDNLNLDLIFGLPGQSLERWRSNLNRALDLHPEHLSLYSLTVEEGTPLYTWASRGLVDVPDGDQAADMMELAMERLESAGYIQYEISNFARRDAQGKLLACRHNLQYWRGLPYLGFGAGAHGYAASVRTANINGVADYIRRSEQGEPLEFPRSPTNQSATRLDYSEEMGEWMMVGLRLTDEGVSEIEFDRRFGRELKEVYEGPIHNLVGAGLLEWTGADDPHLRLTRRGRLLGNQVFVQFI